MFGLKNYSFISLLQRIFGNKKPIRKSTTIELLPPFE